jgi:hypothetical protein
MTQPRIPTIEDYEPLIGAGSVERIHSKAEKFKGLRVANFNSTYYGGGVAEMLSSLTLLMNGLGLQTEWRVIQGTPDFFSITKRCTTRCKGAKSICPESRRKSWNRSCTKTACAISSPMTSGFRSRSGDLQHVVWNNPPTASFSASWL